MKKTLARELGVFRLSIALLAGTAAIALGAKTTSTINTGNWNDVIWNAGAPDVGDTVVVAHNIRLTNSTPICGSVTVNASKTLTFSGTNTILLATNVTLFGTVTHDPETQTNGTPGVYSSWTPDNWLWIQCSNLTVAAGSVIDANGKGYAGGITKNAGSGPGGGGGNNGNGAGGGGYGGVGGTYAAAAPGGVTYGSATSPVDPGSGGGGSDVGAGANGGGYIRLDVAGQLLVNGTIRANGNSAANWRAAAGSGGGILITCQTIAATNGLISADAGNGNGNKTDISGGGGGGRVSILYDTAAESNLVLTAPPTLQISANDGCAQVWGRPGTISLPDTSVFPGAVLQGGQLVIPNFTAWAPNSLTVSNGLAVFPAGFHLSVANDLNVGGLGGLELSNGCLTVGRNLTIRDTVLYWNAYYTLARSRFYAGTDSVFQVNGIMSVEQSQFYLLPSGTSAPVLQVGGDLVVTNDARFYVYAAPTNGAAGAWGALISVASNLVIGGGAGAGSWVYPNSDPLYGGAPLFRVRGLMFTTTNNSGFDATGLGYQGGTNYENGWGPGGGKFSGNYGGGGGYGGYGGTALTSAGGGTFGSSNAPVESGGGGAGSNTGGTPRNGAGGGVVRLEVSRTAMLSGRIKVNGGNATQWRAGGGAGGAVYIRCRTLATTNTAWISSDGGAAMQNSGSGGGGGGGGRVAIWRTFDQTNGGYSITAAGCTNLVYSGPPPALGTNGTIVWGLLPGVPLVDNAGGATGVTVYSACLNGTVISTGTAPCAVSVFWGLTDGGTNRSAWGQTNAFDGTPTDGTLLTTNIGGLSAQTPYFYRFYATNDAGESWAESTMPFATPPGLPVVANSAQGATNITLTSACLNGVLSSTGTAPTVASVYWGPVDGGTNAAAWANTNVLAGFCAPGALTANVGLSASNVTYFYTYAASNAGGVMFAAPSVRFQCAPVWAVATKSNAQEKGANKAGAITFYRTDAPAVTNWPLTVLYAISGTASNSLDYDTLSGVLTIASGSTSGTVTIAPLMDAVQDDGETAILTVAPGPYAIGSPSNATVTIADSPPAATNTWTGSGNWTNRANWSDEMAPAAGQRAVVSGTVTVDVSAAMGSLTVNAGATLVFEGWNAAVTATDIWINGLSITHNFGHL